MDVYNSKKLSLYVTNLRLKSSLIIFTMCYVLPAFCQDASRFSGAWIYQTTPLMRPDTTCNKQGDNRFLDYPGIKGVMFNFSWKRLQPSAPGDTSSSYFSSGGFNWYTFDSTLAEATRRGLHIGILIWTGEDAPSWLYDSPYQIGSCETSAENACNIRTTKKFPDYFNNTYETLWRTMTDSVLKHINNSGNVFLKDGNSYDYRQSVAFYQSCQGSTGDLDPQKGKLLMSQPPFCEIDEETWFEQKVKPSWLYTDSVLRANKSNLPNIHLLVNNGNAGCFNGRDLDSGFVFDSTHPFVEDGRLFDFTNKYLPDAWRKNNGSGHFYQLNYETYYNKAFENIQEKSAFAPGNNPVLIRDECDVHNILIKGGVTPNHVLYIAANALASGLDMWMMSYDVLYANDSIADPSDTSVVDNFIHPANQWIVNFFNRHSQKHAPSATYAFCALHDGIDGGNYSRFPTAVYSNGDTCMPSAAYKRPNKNLPNNDSANLNCGSRRLLSIQSGLADRGCLQNDAPSAQGRPIRQRNSVSDVNDCGWYLHQQNYQRFMRQINVINKNTFNDSLNSTSIGYWNKYYPDVNTSDTNYNNQLFGRFSKGFDLANKKNALLFDLDDDFIQSHPTCLPAGYAVPGHPGKLFITYNDSGYGRWSVYYDAYRADGTHITKRLKTVRNTNKHQWITKEFSIPCDAAFTNGGIYGSDFFISSVGQENVMFALIEYKKETMGHLDLSSTNGMQLNLPDVSLMPNPASALVNISAITDIQIGEVYLYDLTGLLRLHKQAVTTVNSIDVTGLPAGIYQLVLIDQKRKVHRAKLVVQR